MSENSQKLIPSDDADIGTLNLWFKCSVCDTLHLEKQSAFGCHNADVKYKVKPVGNNGDLFEE